MLLEVDKLTIFGDTTGIRPGELNDFCETTKCAYGGSFPDYEADLSHKAVVKKTREVLAKANMPNSLPIIPCRSAEERARYILKLCAQHRVQNGAVLFWVIDKHPHSFVEAVKSVADHGSSLPAEILKSITVVNFGTPADRIDPFTGIRMTTLPRPFYHSPMHPTPAD